MRGLVSVLALSLMLSASPLALAQPRNMESASTDMLTAQAEAQAAAVHPGDEALTCDQLQAEMGASMNSDTMVTERTELQASAERQQELQRAASERARGQMATNVVTGIIGSFVPGAGYAQAAAARAQAAQQQRDAAASQQEMAGMIGNMSNMMPGMMRGQRVVELARAKDCEFTRNMPGIPPQPAPP